MQKCRKEKATKVNSDKALLDVLLSGMKQGWMASLDEDGNVVFAVPEEDDDDDSVDERSCSEQHFVGGEECFMEDNEAAHMIHSIMNSWATSPKNGMEKVIKVGNKTLRLSVSLREETS
eukprot:jgi/Mesvir1/21647/Mv04068-RA.1